MSEDIHGLVLLVGAVRRGQEQEQEQEQEQRHGAIEVERRHFKNSLNVSLLSHTHDSLLRD
jgi:hypothetical protein